MADPELDPNGPSPSTTSNWFDDNPPPPSGENFSGVTPDPNMPADYGSLISNQYQQDFGRAPTAAELSSDTANAEKYGWNSGPNGGVQATIDQRMNNIPNQGEHATGGASLGSLMGGSGPNGQWTGSFTPPTAEDARNTPGYQFAVGEIARLGQNSAAARGTLLNPRTTQALNQAETGFADTNYNQVYNNAWNNYLNKEQVTNSNFANAQTGLMNNAQIQNMLFNQGLQGSYLGLFGQNQNFTQGQTAGQNLFGNWLQSQYLYRPPYPTS